MPQPEMLNDIKTVLDISSRVDERVKAIQASQQELSHRINQFSGELNNVMARIMVLESKNGGRIHEVEEMLNAVSKKIERMDVGGTEFSKTQKNDFDLDVKAIELNMKDMLNKISDLEASFSKIESHHNSWQETAKKYGSLVIQGIWVIIVCYLLYKLGLSTPPLP